LFYLHRVQHTLWLVSDSYIGLDQLYDVRLNVIKSDIQSQVNQEVYMAKEMDVSRWRHHSFPTLNFSYAV